MENNEAPAKARGKAPPWKKGQSGNPAGTKRGSRHRAPKRKLENSEQRPAPETRPARAEMLEIADQRLGHPSLTCGNVGDSPPPGNNTPEPPRGGIKIRCLTAWLRPSTALAARLQTGRGRHQPKWLVQDVGEEGGLERFRRPCGRMTGSIRWRPGCACVAALAQNLPLKYSFAAHVEAQPERLYFLMDPGLGHSAL